MSWTDDISEFDGMLPMFGFGGLIVFLILCACAYYSEQDAIKYGFPATVTAIGTCRDADCAIRVTRTSGEVLDRTTGSRVITGDKVQCNKDRCYKE
jgi:hypothetical protein